MMLNNFKKLLNIILPHCCFGCDKLIFHSGFSGLCVECFKEVEFFHINFHPELSDFLKKTEIDSFDSLFLYSKEVKDIILDFKFNDQEEKGIILSKLLSYKVKNLENSLIVPVPIHKKRLRQRKFNQSAILGKSLSRKLSVDFSNQALKKVIYTEHQTKTNKKKRASLQKGSFLADSSIVENKNIILIDDVFTTGATSAECAKELKAKGAKTVNVLTIAYTPI